MNLASVQTMASGKLSCLACRSSMRSSLRSPSSSSALSKASFVQRRIVGSGSLPSAQARTVVRTATNRFTTSARHESRTTMTQQQHQQQQHSQQHGAKCLHSSSHQDQSTLAATASMEFMTPASHMNLSASSSIPRPTFAQLKELFFASSISFVGFGFVDNIVMISSGSWIDATLGVKFGLATMTAAAMGQVVSDVSGVVFGGTMERFLKQWNLVKEPSLSAAQRGLTLCRNVSLAGSAFGVMLGCMLGACSLLFMDLESHERQKNAIQLRSIVQDMMMSSSSPQDDAGLNCESCTVLLADGTKGFASLRAESSQQHSTRRPEASIDFLQQAGAGRAAECAKRRDVITNVCDQVMYVPVVSVDGSDLLAVIEFRNKKSSAGTFTEEDEQTAKIMARHVAIFMQHLS